MMKKEYLLKITSVRGCVISIGYYPDTPDKNYRIYNNGGDVGYRFERIGNASRKMHDIARAWAKNGIDYVAGYGFAEEVPVR